VSTSAGLGGGRVLGIDAAGRHGWVGVVADGGGFVAAHVHAELAGLVAMADDEALAAGAGPLAVVGVDIPVGLVDGPRRSADVAARAFVGARRSSVFPAPPRSVAGLTTQAEVNAHLAAIGLPLLSAQAVGLMGRIRETAAWAARDGRVREIFPEASFRQLAGASLPHAKKAAAGALHRIELLAGADPALVLPAELGPAGVVALDDLLDAAAVAWSAWRCAQGRALALGHPDEVDPDTGRRIAVWV
jgi:predicted RNase H-like nuclease